MRAVGASPGSKEMVMLCEYIFEKTGSKQNPLMCSGFAFLSDDGKFWGGATVGNIRYYPPTGRAIDVEISCAAEKGIIWRDVLMKTVFQYIFVQLQCVRCTAITKKSNVKSRKFLEGLKFALEGNIRKGYDGEKDALVYGLLAEDCPYVWGV